MRERADPKTFYPAPSLWNYGRALICFAAAVAIAALAALGA